MDDVGLLQQFVRGRREAALEEIVRWHADLVYSSALRQTRGDRSLAEDVTQEVFVLLATKAATIRDGKALAGWLLVTTRFVALNALRSAVRRRRYEREAADMKRDDCSDSGDPPEWEGLAPLLDKAMAGLKREDRDAPSWSCWGGRRR